MRDIADYSKHYLESGFEDYLVEYRRRIILNAIKEYHPYKILEIGCGMRPLFDYIDYQFDEYTIYEPSEEFYANALARREESKYSDRIVIHNECYRSEEESSVDFLICSSLLHELENPGEMLDDIYRNCRSDTIIHFNVPNANSLHRLLAFYAGMIKNVDEFSGRNILFQQHSVFSKDSFSILLGQHGFEVIESGSYFIKPFTHDQMKRMLDEKIITEDVLEGLFNLSKELPDYGCEIFFNCRVKDNKYQ